MPCRVDHVLNSTLPIKRELCKSNEHKTSWKVKASGNGCSSQENEKCSSYLQMWTEEELRQKQADDPDILPLMQWKKNSEVRPIWKEISSSSGLTKFFWTQWYSLDSVRGVLYRWWEVASGNEVERLLLAPKVIHDEILKHLHSFKTGGVWVWRKLVKEYINDFTGETDGGLFKIGVKTRYVCLVKRAAS